MQANHVDVPPRRALNYVVRQSFGEPKKTRRAAAAEPVMTITQLNVIFSISNFS